MSKQNTAQGGDMGVLGAAIRPRATVIDFIRGLAISVMVVYHLLYTLGNIFGFTFFKDMYKLFYKTPLIPIFAGLFILISGISSSFSRNNIKRGIKTLSIGLGITFVTAVIMPLMKYNKLAIYFGILHFLGCAMLLSPILLKLAKKIPPYVGIPLSVILFALTYKIIKGYIGLSQKMSVAIPEFLMENNYLFPFGIINKSYRSADYYPILPWIFIFIIGIYLGIKAKRDGFPRIFYKPLLRPIEWIGRHTLYIYVAHQPVIFLIGISAKFILMPMR